MPEVGKRLFRGVDYLDKPRFRRRKCFILGAEAVMVTVVQRRKGGASFEIDLVDDSQGQPS
jgi:hypothetical protein